MIDEKDQINVEAEKTSATEIRLEEVVLSSPNNEKPVQLLIQNENNNRAEQTYVVELHDNDRKIISLLQQDGGVYLYTFNGLARKLRMHQQSLARSLYRLINLKLIQKSKDGYKLKESNALQVFGHSYGTRIAANGISQKPCIQLIQAYIPLASTNDAIVRHLIGKWFGNLRWLGFFESKDGSCLQWTNNDDSFLIVVRIVSRYLTIETNATSDKDKVEAIADGCRIFERVIGVMQGKLNASDYVFTLNTCHTQNLRAQNN